MQWVSGGVAPILQFNDTLLRTGTTAIGPPWVIGYSDPSQVGWYNTTGGITCNNTTGLTCTNPTGGGSSVSLPIVPGISRQWEGKTQFAELVGTAAVANSSSCGPAVALSGDSSTGTANGYYLELLFTNQLRLSVANVGQRIVQAPFGAWAIGDVVRISVQFQSGQNTILVSNNGALILTAVDNNALRPLPTNNGLPGIYYKGATPATSTKMKNFRCGVGLG